MRRMVDVSNNYPILKPISFIVLVIYGLFGFWYCSHCKEIHHLKDVKKGFYKKSNLASGEIGYACSRQYGW